MDFLGIDNWAPGGYVSPGDERAMQYAYAQNIMIPGMYYSYVAFEDGKYVSDEVYGGNSFQYIPTEIEIGAAIAVRNMSTAGELPVHSNSPGMNQLLQTLYKRTAEFWQDIRNASNTGW